MNPGTCSRRDFLRAAGLGAVVWVAPASAARRNQASDSKPNVIFILVDDLGWAELGCYGNMFNETRHLDRLAKQGMRFTDAYAAAPVCSPYRAALMTGQYPARVGITDYLRPDDTNHLGTQYVTIAGALKKAGYATGIIGKWHLSGYANHGAEEFPPALHGFDETIVSENRGIGGGSYFHPYHFNREVEKRLPGGREHLVERCNLEAVEFIERHKDQPFFLYLSHYAVHTRLDGKPEYVAEFEKKPGAGTGQNASRNNPHLAAQLKSIDDGVGMILSKLDELGLADETILVFTGDNGGESRVTRNGPLRAGKSTLYEGGIRVPLIIRYPKLVQAGTTCGTPTSNIDFYPTFCELAGVKPKGHHIDGVSITFLLHNPNARLRRDTLYWHYPLDKPHFLGGRSASAIRKGDWKLIEFFDTGEKELYNLADDVGEQENLVKENPAKVAELSQLLIAWRKEVGAKIPGGQQGGKTPL